MHVQTGSNFIPSEGMPPNRALPLPPTPPPHQQPTADLDEVTQAQLADFNTASDALIKGTETGSLSKKEIVEKIATLNSQWRILIRGGNRDQTSGAHVLGSEC